MDCRWGQLSPRGLKSGTVKAATFEYQDCRWRWTPEAAMTSSGDVEYGIKGGGEGGRMGAPGALSRAIEDALSQYGVRCDELPLTPRKVRELVRAGEKR
jgi:hypothetical protein